MFNKERLINIMEEKDISAYKLWKLSGVAQSTISDILNKDDKNPTAKTLQKIADALGVSVDEFFKSDDDKNNINNKVHNSSLGFSTPEEAIKFILEQPTIMGFGGFDINKMSDDEIMDFANELLRQLQLISYKYKK